MVLREDRYDQAGFLSVLPRIERIIRRKIWPREDWHAREDLVAEALGYAWQQWRRAVLAGKRPAAFWPQLARWAAGYALRGYRLAGRGRGCRPTVGLWQAGKALEGLRGRKRVSTPADQVCLKIDLAAWSRQLAPRARRTMKLLAKGHSPVQVAALLGVRTQSIHRIRMRLQRSWRAYQAR